MSVSVVEFNNIKAYDFSGGATNNPSTIIQNAPTSAMPSLSSRSKGQQEGLSIIHDFGFRISSSDLQISQNQDYIIAGGVYKPTLKIFDVNNLSLKHGRGIDSEIIKLRILSEDYKKVAMICADRNIEIHAQYGRHFKIRTPKRGRDLLWNAPSAELIVGGTSNEIWRLNLEEGRFMKSLDVGAIGALDEATTPGVNCVGYNQQLDLLFAGCDDGKISVFDLRSKDKGKESEFIPLNI